ncbi:hypothetical protein L1765_06725 [Microaerobacter geothermalis]|nr:hypothetical protein [Microaerobacter geothermalis]
MADCYRCNGNGEVVCPTCRGEKQNHDGKHCNHCHGEGIVHCSYCGGNGSLEVC